MIKNFIRKILEFNNIDVANLTNYDTGIVAIKNAYREYLVLRKVGFPDHTRLGEVNGRTWLISLLSSHGQVLVFELLESK